MSNESKNRYRLFRKKSKNGIFFVQDNQSGKQASLRTRDKHEATRRCHAMNEAQRQPHMNLQIARSYLLAADPTLVTRTWQEVMEAIVRKKTGPTQERWAKAVLNADYHALRKLKVVETRAEHFLKILESKKPSTNAYLRRIHNFALGMDWLLKPVLPRQEWPPVVYGKKRGITLAEHRRILAREGNPERRDYYELCWHLGGSQMDIADLHAEDVNWADRTVSYNRKKLATRPGTRINPAIIHFGDAVAAILRRRPPAGPLFPRLRLVRSSDRATEFHQRCAGLGIVGVTLHSYRYAWAGRARQCGYPLRFAQEALGHNSKAVHHAYAGKSEVTVPSLDAWEHQMEAKMDALNLDQSATSPTLSDKPAAEPIVAGGHRLPLILNPKTNYDQTN